MADGRILLVEDDPSLRTIIGEALSDDGYQVAIADNGAAALELARRSAPDLVILDLMMPRMGGEEFFAALREVPELVSVPIIIVSAARATSEVGARLGAVAALHKPFDLYELIERVEDLLGPAPEPLSS